MKIQVFVRQTREILVSNSGFQYYFYRVTFILTLISLMLLLDALWWIAAARIAKKPVLRNITAIFMGAQMAGFSLIIAGRMSRLDVDRWMPKFALSAVFIWHFLGLGILLVLFAVILPVMLFVRLARMMRRKTCDTTAPEKTDDSITRRDFLGVATAVLPPLITLGATGIAMRQLANFRTRRFVLPIPQLPRDLDGLTIAHVSDIHVGRFTSGRVLREMVDRVNSLRADLVLLTGDLINDALADLPEGLDLVRKMEGRSGVCMIEGNHDLIENPEEFERRAQASGIPFLLNESAIQTIHGFPVQLLGLPWLRRGSRKGHDQGISDSVRDLLHQRREDAFAILMAHHPHAFDAAADAGVPLVLSGHTHGGQLMLNEQCGFGPAMFRYWSGLYQKENSRMIVSNGIGNWYPIRVNSPAELVHITLRRA